MPVDMFWRFLDKAYHSHYENRCWNKWLVEGSEKNYDEYKKDFFQIKKKPDLQKALKLAEEIKRREEANK